MESNCSTLATGDDGDQIAISVIDPPPPPTIAASSREKQMDSSFSTIPTGTRDKVVISVKDAPPLPSYAAKSLPGRDRFPFFFFVYIFALNYLQVLAMIQMTFNEEKQSPFETHRGLMRISYVALSVTALTSGMLLYTRKCLQNSRREAILGCISIYLASLACVCLLLVLGLPQNLNWVGYLVVAATFVIAIGCYFIGRKSVAVHHEEDVYNARQVIHEDRICSNYSTTLLPLPIVLVLFVPDKLSWISLWVDGAAILIAIAYNMIVYLKKKSVKVKEERNLEKLNKVSQ